MGDIDYIGNIIADADDLQHFGVKGMKWGVRRDNGRGKIRRGATKANVALKAGEKVINAGEKKLLFLPQKNRDQAATRTQTRILGIARTLNKDPRYKGKDLKTNPKLKQSYHDAIAQRAAKIYLQELGVARVDAWKEFLGVDKPSDESIVFRASKDHIEHADTDPTEIVLALNLTLDDLGQVIDVESVDPSTLEHSGVKGMKWGIRKMRGEPAHPTNAHHGNPKANETNADRYTRLLSQAKKEGANSLSDDDLKFVTLRGDAISKVNRLNQTNPNWVHDAANQALKQAAKKGMQMAVEHATKKYITGPLLGSKNSPKLSKNPPKPKMETVGFRSNR
jgi:hypothetical protein